jgi:hypothetical protein
MLNQKLEKEVKKGEGLRWTVVSSKKKKKKKKKRKRRKSEVSYIFTSNICLNFSLPFKLKVLDLV